MQVGHSVSLMIADGKGDEVINNINIYDVGSLNVRLNSILNTSRRVFVKAQQLDVDIYHFHDPELIYDLGGLAEDKSYIARKLGLINYF